MPKRANPEKKKAEVLFRKGMKSADIAKKLGIPDGTVRRWKKEYADAAAAGSERSGKSVHNEQEPDVQNARVASASVQDTEVRTVIRNRGQARPGNVNSVGNKGGEGGPLGNKKAEVHGLYAKYLPPETLDIMDGLEAQSPLDALWDQILNQRAIILRSQKIFEMKRGEKTIEIVSDSEEGTSYMIQEPWDKEAQYITAFSRAQATLQSMIRTYFEMEGKNRQEAAAGSKDWKAAILEIARRRREADAGVEN